MCANEWKGMRTLRERMKRRKRKTREIRSRNTRHEIGIFSSVRQFVRLTPTHVNCVFVPYFASIGNKNNIPAPKLRIGFSFADFRVSSSFSRHFAADRHLVWYSCLRLCIRDFLFIFFCHPNWSESKEHSN